MKYFSLEDPDVRQRALEDPKTFLDTKDGLILDEIQKAPKLFSYIQTIVDNNDKRKFVLSGSQNFLLLQKISQTLAGRTAIFQLLPLSLEELKPTKYKIKNIYKYIFDGSYPRLYKNKIPTAKFYTDYIQTYIQRDVRDILNIENLNRFQLFIQLCAGRIGQLLNLNSLASDAGITFNTAKSWLSVLETSYILYTLQPHHKNFKKRLVKSPKLYFYDTGIACNLLNIKTKEELETHYIRGNMFENFVINELIKNKHNNAEQLNFNFWRDNYGKEIDLTINIADELVLLEIKSSATYKQEYFKNIIYLNKISETDNTNNYLVYSGNDSYKVKDGNLVSWNDLGKIPLH